KRGIKRYSPAGQGRVVCGWSLEAKTIDEGTAHTRAAHAAAGSRDARHEIREIFRDGTSSALVVRGARKKQQTRTNGGRPKGKGTRTEAGFLLRRPCGKACGILGHTTIHAHAGILLSTCKPTARGLPTKKKRKS
ncbi:unnamed protein product, partial [Ectocarpus sp. 6 AP-2014]